MFIPTQYFTLGQNDTHSRFGLDLKNRLVSNDANRFYTFYLPPPKKNTRLPHCAFATPPMPKARSSPTLAIIGLVGE